MATSKHTHTCAQCSPTSVGLTEARLNKKYEVSDTYTRYERFKLKWTISDALWYMCVAYEVVVESVHFITSTQLKYIHFR